MKVLMLQSHSQNNEKLYNLTIDNHIKYCNKFGINFLTEIKPYNVYGDYTLFIDFLKNYDLVFSIGSDCLFTDFNRNILDFLDLNKPVNLVAEDTTLGYINGEIEFYSKDSIDFLNFFINECKIQNNLTLGQQQVLSNLYAQNHPMMNKYCHYIPEDDIFTYVGYGIELIYKSIIYRNRHQFLYKPGDFMIHVLGGSNDFKYNVLKYLVNGENQ